MENNGHETRLGILESRVASLESRQSILEGYIGAVLKRKPKRELTPEQKAEIRTRLVAGQERKRKEREAEAKSQDQDTASKFVDNNLDYVETNSKPTKKGKKEANNGTSETKNKG